MKRSRKFQLLGIAILIFLGLGIWMVDSRLPDHLHVIEGKEKEQLSDLSFGSLVTGEVVPAGSQGKSNIPSGEVKVECRLLGLIPIKEVAVSPVEETSVIPCGMPIGIYMQTDGILVVGTGVVNGMDGLDYEPALNIMQSGDYIVGVNGISVSTKEELVEAVNASKGKEVVFQMFRDGNVTSVKISPVQTGDGEYKVGLWVRDDTQGIGTLTYVAEDGSFGALGHGISDVDTNTILSIREGTLYNADILSITKGERGAPGELCGVIHYQDGEELGTIQSNTETGIFGTLTEFPEGYEKGEAIPVGFKQEIEEGPAQIMCSLNGTVNIYDIEIEKVSMGSGDVNKSMVIHVTDQELLELTGGIVQGMSGSPIIQNGKFIGAVTHVFIQDATRGYGIFAETMLNGGGSDF